MLSVLKEKHPELWPFSIARLDYESYNNAPETIPLDITAEHIKKVAARLLGAAGVGGIDGAELRHWLLCFGATSRKLQEAMAKTAAWLANGTLNWVAYRALMSCRLVALDKCPGIHPVGIGSIFLHLLAKILLLLAGGQATKACGNTNLCAGLPAVIEGVVH